jgi:hypothetical protein
MALIILSIFVFWGDMKITFSENERKGRATHASTHELGHQRQGLTNAWEYPQYHKQWWSSCVMNLNQNELKPFFCYEKVDDGIDDNQCTDNLYYGDPLNPTSLASLNQSLLFQPVSLSKNLNEVNGRSDLKLTLNLEKDVFLIDEPIYIEVVLENISKKEVFVTPFFYPGAGFLEIALTSEGKKLPYKGHIIDIFIYDYDPGHILYPNEKKILVKDLLDIFGTSDESHYLSYYLPEGEYEIQIIYDSNYLYYSNPDSREGKIKLDRGRMYSNVLKFKVIQPQGEEALVREKLLKVMAEDYKNSYRKNLSSYYYELINNYPNTTYAPLLFKNLSGSLSWPKFKEILLKIVERYKSSYFIEYVISNLWVSGRIQTKGNIEIEKEQIIEDILKKYPNDKAGSYIKNKKKDYEIAIRSKEYYEKNVKKSNNK